MTQPVAGVRRRWLVFSALAFLVSGVLLYVQLAGRTGSASKVVMGPPLQDPPPVSVMREGKIGSSSGTATPTKAPAPLDPPVPRDAQASKPGEGSVPATGKAIHHAPDAGKNVEARTPVASGKKKPPSETDHMGAFGKGARPTSPATPKVVSRGIDLDDSDASAPKAGIVASDKPKKDVPHKHRTPQREAAKPDQNGPAPVSEEMGESGAVAAGPVGPALQPPPPPRASDSLTEGLLKVDSPATMLVGQAEHIRAVVGAKKIAELVRREAAADPDSSARVQTERELPVSPLVRMDLRTDGPGVFDITSFTPQAEQRLSESDPTVWEWAVIPKQEGRHGLTLIVSDLDGRTHEVIRNKIYPVHIDVHVSTMQRVREVAVAGSSALSALAGLIGAWLGIFRPMSQRRRSSADGEGEPRAPRAAVAAAAPPPPAQQPAASPPVASAEHSGHGPERPFTD